MNILGASVKSSTLATQKKKGGFYMFTNLNLISRGMILCLALIAITALGGCKEDNGGQSGGQNLSSNTLSSSNSGGPVIPNPEPSTWLLFGSGMAGLGIWHWVKSKNKRK